MKRFISTALAVALLLGLGALAVLALPGAQTALAPADVAAAPAASQNAAPAAPLATKYNVIAMPLDAHQQFADAGQAFDGGGLANIVGTGVVQVLEWNPATGSYKSYLPGQGGDQIDLVVGGVYWLELEGGATNVVSFVGGVPDQGAVQFTLTRPASGNCVYNEISLPLDQDGITTPQALADSIGNVEQMLQWNPATQSYLEYLPGVGGDDIPMKIGYPYTVCLLAGGNTLWPQGE